VKHRYFNRDEIDIKVEQGYEIGRPSVLALRAKADGEVIDVNVGGRVVMIAEGRLA
jgi:trans-2,3-dihydro-3-hydroxyanthranilate isomerase